MPILPNLRTWDRTKHGHPLPILASPDEAADYATFVDTVPKPSIPQAFVDTPQILYSKWLLQAGGIKAALGSFTTPPKIVLIGGGLANCVAGLELAKAGADVTLLEASDQVGGRLESISLNDGFNYAEMGAMRFPPSEDVLYYYARELGFDFIAGFPDPGVVDTLLSYRGKVECWAADQQVPADFVRVHHGWNAFVFGGITSGSEDTKVFLGPDELTTLLQSSYNDSTALTKVVSGWQKYLTAFGADTFLGGLKRIFGPAHEWNIPGGTQWSDDDFNRFGKLGVGSGGFGAFFDRGFTAIVRFVVNGLETDQKIFAAPDEEGVPRPTGIQNLAQRLVALAQTQRTPLKVHLNTFGEILSSTPTSVTVTQLEVGLPKHPSLPIHKVTYDFAIVGTTSRVATGVLAPVYGNIDPAVAQALRTVHTCASSKLFIRTDKFWKTPGTPRVILTDTPVTQLYTLDYNHPDKGLVLVVYAWEQDSIDLQRLAGLNLYQYLHDHLQAALKQSPEWAQWINHLAHFDDLRFKHWQLDMRFLGAFVIAGPSQDRLAQTLFYDHLKLSSRSSSNDATSSPASVTSTPTPEPIATVTENVASASTPTAWSPILLNGDSYGWSGGWTQGALETALNNVSVILKARGKIVQEAFAPTSLIKADTYTY